MVEESIDNLSHTGIQIGNKKKKENEKNIFISYFEKHKERKWQP